MAYFFDFPTDTWVEDASPGGPPKRAFGHGLAAGSSHFASPASRRRLPTITALLLFSLLSASQSGALSVSQCSRRVSLGPLLSRVSSVSCTPSAAASALASSLYPTDSLSSVEGSVAPRAPPSSLAFVLRRVPPAAYSSSLSPSVLRFKHSLPRPLQGSLVCAPGILGGAAGSARFAGCCGSQGRSCGSGKNPELPLKGSKDEVIPRVGTSTAGPRPDWFHVPAPQAASRGAEESRYQQLQKQIRGLDLHTVCEEAKCPNIGECWNGGTATLILLGDTCTRGCRFCAIKTSSKPPPPDPLEPEKVADAVAKWDIDYVVMTSVDRDDMPDGGAGHFARTVQLVKKAKPSMLIECLVSDFQGMEESVRTLAQSGLDVYAHNIETVRRLTPYVRDKRAKYDQSLRVLHLAKQFNPSLFTKSSIMLGLGETSEEVVRTLRDLRDHDVDVVTLGQYLRPTKQQLGVVEYVTPETFKKYQDIAEEMGFKYVASGPLVRSSYKAGEYYMKHLIDDARKHGRRETVKQVKLEADVGTLKGTTTTFQVNEKEA
ncbi:lipoic acid synthase LIPA [Toxoplasma gondii GT1]